MTLTAIETLERYRAVAAAVAALPIDSASHAVLNEQQLLEANTLFAASQSGLRAGGALIAGEVVHRSAPELGSQGLAQKTGHRTPVEFIKHTTQTSGKDAVTAVRVGSLMREAATEGELNLNTGELMVQTTPWLAPVTEALAAREISIDAAEAIRAGLPSPNSVITVEQLTHAAVELVRVAKVVDVDALRKAADGWRDDLDAAGVALREAERRAKRSLKLYPQPDGTTKLVWIMDPETAATVKPVLDRITSPKLNAVRFVDPQRQAKVDQIYTDERSVEQVASDGFEQIIKLGADANPEVMLGSGAPVIHVTTTKTSWETGTGVARIEGQDAPVSVETAKRLAETGTVGAVVLDFEGTGQKLDFGREQRLFTFKQKLALAILWGGCAWPGCDRPPSWTEAHHIHHYKRDNGNTDLDLGILFCKHHHLVLHNNEWEIHIDQDRRYWLIPPPELDTGQTPIELVSKNPALRDLRRAS